jgi:hypothetical protein
MQRANRHSTGMADQQVQSGDKLGYRAGAGSNPDILSVEDAKAVSGLTSPLTAGDKKRSPHAALAAAMTLIWGKTPKMARIFGFFQRMAALHNHLRILPTASFPRKREPLLPETELPAFAGMTRW